MIVEDKCKFVLSKYRYSKTVHLRTNCAFQRETNRQTKQHCWFCQSNVIKCTFDMETGEEVYQDSPLLVLCVINCIGVQNSNEVMMTQFYVNSFIAQMSKKISYFTPPRDWSVQQTATKRTWQKSNPAICQNWHATCCQNYSGNFTTSKDKKSI